MVTQSEQVLENGLIKTLMEMNYEYISIKEEDNLYANFKKQLEKHNKRELSLHKRKHFTDKEFEKICIYLEGGTRFEKAKKLRDLYPLETEDGERIWVEFLNKNKWCQNEFQVSNQITVEGRKKCRYDVTIFEALHKAGGVLVYGIPEFRLPKQKVVAKEIEKVKELGVKFETNVVIGKSTTIDQLMEEEGFEAVFIGSGAGLPMFMGIPGENANEVFSANEYLTRSNLMKAFREDYDTPIAAGKKVAVVGGGNVAMDAARTALRLGAEVHVVYRRSEAELPARAEEVHHAKEEGIIFDLLTNPKKINVDENGNITSMTVIKMELGEPDASGRRRPVEIEGSEYDIEVDTVIMSLGTSPNPLISSTTKGLETNRRKCIVAEEENGQTSKEGVFAGGDAVTGAATVILAMGAGKAGAKGIDEYLRNK